jgi:hypothetical protein
MAAGGFSSGAAAAVAVLAEEATRAKWLFDLLELETNFCKRVDANADVEPSRKRINMKGRIILFLAPAITFGGSRDGPVCGSKAEKLISYNSEKKMRRH